MVSTSTKPSIFISYAHADEPEAPAEGEFRWLSYVRSFLEFLVQQGAAEIWSDTLMLGGEDWDPEIGRKLRECDIFILLVSRYSLSSKYILGKEIAIIRERQAEKQQVQFYPLLLTPTPDGALRIVRDKNMRPRDGKPLSTFSSNERDRQMSAVANEIASIVVAISQRKISASPGANESFGEAQSDTSTAAGKATPAAGEPVPAIGALKHRVLWALAAIVALVGVGVVTLTNLPINWGTGPQGPTAVPPTTPSTPPLAPAAPTSVTSGHYANGKGYPIQGIDVSKFQGDINWNAVAISGIQFAWIKATESTDRIDDSFLANWEGAKAAGVRRGAYHYIDLCQPPMDQVAWFVRNVPADPDALPPALDVEPRSSCSRSLVAPGAIAEVLVMLTEMERHYAKRPVLYIGKNGGSDYLKILSVSGFKDYPVWMADYGANPPSGDPRPWQFWQYNAFGAIAGIRGNVDQNAFYGTPQQWQEFLSAR